MQITGNRKLRCNCGSLAVLTNGQPLLRAYCHCASCRDVYGGVVSAATTWRSGTVTVVSGIAALRCHTHPVRQMQRNYCCECGDIVFGTDRLGLRRIPNTLIAANNAGQIPLALQPTMHQFYAYRQFDVHDDLPKYLERAGGPVHGADRIPPALHELERNTGSSRV